MGVGFAAFFISRVVPADPAAAALGQNAREEQIEAYREQYGLNDPVVVQYVNYMGRLFQGDLGTSLRTRRPIIEDLKDYFPATLELTLAAMLIALSVGLPAGSSRRCTRTGPSTSSCGRWRSSAARRPSTGWRS
jgi:peptide/nickel transport system permease protein